MDQTKIRNIAIIAHVDHGKTTLVDQLFKQSGMFRQNQVVEERLMDSMDLEKERGITISSKNGSFHYRDHLVNIIDTPGHADFGGQVERVLQMADGALLLVDAAEGPMPQTYFVLKKALAAKLPIIVVVNKIDKPAARPDWAVDEVFDLFVKLDAPDDLLDFPICYASAKNGFATLDYNETSENMIPLMDFIIDKIPHPQGDPTASLQLLVSSISYSSYLGRLGIGKITSGTLNINDQIVVMRENEAPVPARITNLYHFVGNKKEDIQSASIGQIVAVAGMDTITVGMTYTDAQNPMPLRAVELDPPTISMTFTANDSPFHGQEGKFVTSRQLRERLHREILSDVALVVEDLQDAQGYKVSGRGELHLSILIEKMRREGYEFQVTRPQVIFKTINGQRQEPYEELTIDVDEEFSGNVISNLGNRKGILLEMNTNNGLTRLKYKIPTRGLLGFRGELMTETKGTGVMNYIFAEYGDYVGPMKNRKRGTLVSAEQCKATAYALSSLQDRGKFFIKPGDNVYEGQILGEHCRDNDLAVNPGKGKKLTNVRAAGSDDAAVVEPPTIMELDRCISFINDDEMIEITPESIRLRKILLKENERRRAKKMA
ncbi:translational GTPase TypA [Candidatus Uabimicrobium amorphum]|uniref:Large ribosomal subunit assembly factor BipA n=1 Tax=Uabimicrobium amorphum TaxID=2596890 RepID=A0A5S9F1Y2_UABAM|nr:translational GTPase TypA [Candidatus Uabimicrobium amorphum]BBM81879.1 GTP-binding protein [Candidatus Uabimicrobium amorphum]